MLVLDPFARQYTFKHTKMSGTQILHLFMHDGGLSSSDALAAFDKGREDGTIPEVIPRDPPRA
jgi:hypothetical protein